MKGLAVRLHYLAFVLRFPPHLMRLDQGRKVFLIFKFPTGVREALRSAALLKNFWREMEAFSGIVILMRINGRSWLSGWGYGSIYIG